MNGPFFTCFRSVSGKGICCLIGLLLGAGAAEAQAMLALLFGKKMSSERLELGIHLGAQASTISGSADSQYRIGFAAGAYTDIKLSEHWRICNYFIVKSPRGISNTSLRSSLGQPIDTVFEQGGSLNRSLSYMELTPLIRYQLSPSFSVGVGPQVSYLVSATDQYNQSAASGELIYRYDIRSSMQRLDVGATADIQYQLLKGKGLRINLRYSAGFLDVYKPATGFSGRNSVWHLGVGIPIGNKSSLDQVQPAGSDE
jgi:hypothetical protein